jgi:hypothetical protein
MLKKIYLFLAFSFIFYSAAAIEPVSINTFFNSKDIDRVKKGEIITRMYLKNNAVDENTDLSINIPSTKYINEDFGIYEMITDEKAFFPYKIESSEKKLKFYNTLTAFSKLTGMNYYSRKIQKVDKLILSSYRIESPSKTKALDDIVYSQINDKVINYFIQKDNKFGNLSYESELYNEGDNFILINKCLDPIKLAVIVSKKEEFKIISYFIYDRELGGFFYYSAQIMRIRAEFTLKKNKIMAFTLFPTTFSNRIRAATVHFAKMIGLNWDEKLNPWDEDKMDKGFYKNY